MRRESLRVSAISERPRRPPEEFLSAELSWLDFNTRVLALAEDPSLPLLARVRFLSIVSSNLDEFVMVRVGALKRANEHGARLRFVITGPQILKVLNITGLIRVFETYESVEDALRGRGQPGGASP